MSTYDLIKTLPVVEVTVGTLADGTQITTTVSTLFPEAH